MSSLSALVDILATQVKIIEAAYAKAGQSVPSLDDLYTPSPLDFDPALSGARQLIAAAAHQLGAAVRHPAEYARLEVMGLYSTVALGAVEDANVADILAEAGPQVCAPTWTAHILRLILMTMSSIGSTCQRHRGTE